MSMARVVMDANVFVSAAFGGRTRKVVETVFSEHELFLSEKILLELNGLELLFNGEQKSRWKKIIRRLVSLSSFVIPPKLQICRDPKDDIYLATAVAANADFFFTGDKDLLEIPFTTLRSAGLKAQIVTPKTFLRMNS